MDELVTTPVTFRLLADDEADGPHGQRLYDPSNGGEPWNIRPNPSHLALNGADGRKRRRVRSLSCEGWQAEEEGLCDALFNRNHTNQYQHCPPGVFERYVMGLQDGQALIRAAAVDQHFTTPAHRTHV